jgi:Fe-S cluster assembly iron-binding protein IscA
MILVSDLAKAALWESLQESGIEAGQGLRLTATEGAFTLDLDYPNEKDRVIEHRDATVIIVDQETEDRIGDAIIDINEGENGSELVFRKIYTNSHRPNADL